MGRSCCTLVANPDCHSALLADAAHCLPLTNSRKDSARYFLQNAIEANGSQPFASFCSLVLDRAASSFFPFFLALDATVYGARWSRAFLPNAARRCRLASPRFMPLKFCPTRLGFASCLSSSARRLGFASCSRGSTGQVGSPISGFVWQVLMVLSML